MSASHLFKWWWESDVSLITFALITCCGGAGGLFLVLYGSYLHDTEGRSGAVTVGSIVSGFLLSIACCTLCIVVMVRISEDKDEEEEFIHTVPPFRRGWTEKELKKAAAEAEDV